MVLNNFSHTKLLYRPRGRLIRLFLAGVGRKVAITFLSIFSPLYIYQLYTRLGSSFKQAVLLVTFYFLLIYLTKIITIAFAEDLSRKIGFKKTMWFSAAPFTGLILSLVLSQFLPWLVFPGAIFWGMHAGLFWWGYHGYFVKTGDYEHFGEGIGEADLIQTLAASLTPIIGAIATSFLGFMAPFILSAVFMLLGLILLGTKKDTKQHHDVKVKEVLSLMWNRKLVSASYASFQADTSIYLIIWPLFLFLFFKSVISLGEIISISAFIAGILGIVAGRFVDKKGENKVVGAGSILLFFSWITKFFGRAASYFVGSEITRYFGFKFVDVSFGELSYKKATEKWFAHAMLFREFSFSIGGIFAVLIVATMVYFGFSLSTVFVAAAFITLTPLLAVLKGKIHGR
jgi:MFS family permease